MAQLLTLYVPHVPGSLRPETVHAIAQLEPAPQTCYVPLSEAWSYAQLLSNLWRAGRGFIILEQDIVPQSECYAQLRDCPHEWCAWTYTLGAGMLACHGLGLAKFEASLIQRLPHALEGVRGAPWWHCDGLVADALMAETVSCHHHFPPIAHEHWYGPPAVGEACPWPAHLAL